MLMRRAVQPDEVRISNRATYWPIAPIDVVLGAPLVARIVLGATPVGRVVQAVTLGLYLGSAVQDWRDRRGIRRIDFRREFGADGRHLVTMPKKARETEVAILAGRLNDELVLDRVPRREIAVRVEQRLTDYVAGITGQRVRTSAEVRDFALVSLAFPSALGACDILTGDVAIFKDMGLLEPHIIAHEFCHRRGHWRELDAQVLAYLALASSGDPVLAQSALFERLHRNLRVLAEGDTDAFTRLVAASGLRAELREMLAALRPPSNPVNRRIDTAIRRLYDARMRLTGQNGLSDYDLGFTNFLYTFETGPAARQAPPPAGALHRRALA